jgi:hypothetical protein
MAIAIYGRGRGRKKLTSDPPASPADDDAYANELLPTPLAFDYRFENVTAQAKWNQGYRDLVVVWKQNDTPTSRAQMDLFRSLGGRLWISVEPWVRTVGPRPGTPTIYASEIALYNLAETHGAWLYEADMVTITNPNATYFGVGGTRGLNFDNIPFANAFADWIHSLWGDIAGVYHDYGFPNGGLSWVEGYTHPIVTYPGNWENWSVGRRASFDRERALYPTTPLLLAQYGNVADLEPMIPPRATGVIIEAIAPYDGSGPAAFTYKEAWLICRQAKAQGLRPMLWCLHNNTTHRRVIACMCVATRGYMEWRWGNLGGENIWPSYRIHELMELSIGTVAGAAVQLTTDVWLATGTRGYVVINLSASPYVYEGRSVGVDDGLMVQTRALGGTVLTVPWTNEGQ